MRALAAEETDGLNRAARRSNIDVRLLPQGAKELGDKTVIPKFDMDFELIWGTDGNEMRLQAIEEIQSPVNRHPVTGRPAFFCNMHNQARFLRDRRPCAVPEVGMTDVFFGDLSIMPLEVAAKVNEACEKNIVKVPMQSGDVLLCDNYRVLHGRDVFEGDRLSGRRVAESSARSGMATSAASVGEAAMQKRARERRRGVAG